MHENHEPLSSFIKTITQLTNIHICIHDISGILDFAHLQLDSNYQTHAKIFCNTAKSTPKGFQLCIGCKVLANKKAITEKTAFHGHCPYGMFEVVRPVMIDDKAQCIIYIGNIVLDMDKTVERIHRTCKITKVSEQDLFAKIAEAQHAQSIDCFVQLANLIDSYIHMLYEHDKFQKTDIKKHWAVSTLESYVNKNFNQNISLQSISKLYFVNDKYMGRLFKKQMGLTFHEYLNNIRLDQAVDMLLHSNESVISIAMNSGFQNVTYFNRVFLKKYALSPTQYRKDHTPTR